MLCLTAQNKTVACFMFYTLKWHRTLRRLTFPHDCPCRRHPLCDLSGPKLPASDHRPAWAGGWVAVSPAGRVPDGKLQRGSAPLLFDRPPRLNALWRTALQLKRSSDQWRIRGETLARKVRVHAATWCAFPYICATTPGTKEGRWMFLTLACFSACLHLSLCCSEKDRWEGGKKHSWNWTWLVLVVFFGLSMDNVTIWRMYFEFTLSGPGCMCFISGFRKWGCFTLPSAFSHRHNRSCEFI